MIAAFAALAFQEVEFKRNIDVHSCKVSNIKKSQDLVGTDSKEPEASSKTNSWVAIIIQRYRHTEFKVLGFIARCD